MNADVISSIVALLTVKILSKSTAQLCLDPSIAIPYISKLPAGRSLSFES